MRHYPSAHSRLELHLSIRLPRLPLALPLRTHLYPQDSKRLLTGGQEKLIRLYDLMQPDSEPYTMEVRSAYLHSLSPELISQPPTSLGPATASALPTRRNRPAVCATRTSSRVTTSASPLRMTGMDSGARTAAFLVFVPPCPVGGRLRSP